MHADQVSDVAGHEEEPDRREARRQPADGLQPPEPGRAFPKTRPRRSSKLDAFKSHVRARLESFDLPAAVLFREIRAMGYAGGLSQLQEFVRPLNQQLIRRVTERFETIAGQQAQIDWGECRTIEVGGERRKLYVFVMVLGFSRMMYAQFTLSSKLPVLLACLTRAFRRSASRPRSWSTT